MKKFLTGIILANLLSACTDYVQQIDDQYDEMKVAQTKIYSSSNEVQSSSARIDFGSEYDELANTLTDLRNNQIYKTVIIGMQTWMAENLNYETVNSYCYNDDSANCAKYGHLYLWSAAMDSVGIWSMNGMGCGYDKICSPTYPVRGVCPEGWHLPSKEEWGTLFSAVGGSSSAGKMLKSISGWNENGNGTDAYSFAALPAGDRSNFGGFIYEGYSALFWSSTEDYRFDAYVMLMSYNVDGADQGKNVKNHGFSVRCIKDDGEIAVSSSSKKDESSSSISPKSSSSETSESSSSIALGMIDPSTIVKGKLTDFRDDLVYKTVSIGSQTWLAENLNYETSNSYCYNDSAEYCTKYGRLYTWATAMDSVGTWSANGKGCGYGKTCSPTYPVRGVCPEGWHLPTQTEWNTLFTAVGGSSTAGKMLKSTSGWKNEENGVDAYSFSVLPAGHMNNGVNYGLEGGYAGFWSSTGESTGNTAYYVYLYSDNVNLTFSSKYNAFSVRCLKD